MTNLKNLGEIKTTIDRVQGSMANNSSYLYDYQESPQIRVKLDSNYTQQGEIKVINIFRKYKIHVC